MSVEMEQQPLSSKRSPVRKSSPSGKRKAKSLSVRHMFYASIGSALLTYSALSSDMSVVSAMCRLVPMITSGETSLPSITAGPSTMMPRQA